MWNGHICEELEYFLVCFHNTVCNEFWDFVCEYVFGVVVSLTKSNGYSMGSWSIYHCQKCTGGAGHINDNSAELSTAISSIGFVREIYDTHQWWENAVYMPNCSLLLSLSLLFLSYFFFCVSLYSLPGFSHCGFCCRQIFAQYIKSSWKALLHAQDVWHSNDINLFHVPQIFVAVIQQSRSFC